MAKLLGTHYSTANLLYNPEGAIFQRTTTPATGISTGTGYGVDRWRNCGWTNSIKASQSTDTVAGCKYAIKLDKTLADGRIGAIQILENADTIPLQGKAVTFTVMLKTEGTEVTSINMSILGYTGTADSISTTAVINEDGLSYGVGWVNYGTKAVTISSTYAQYSMTAVVGNTCNNIAFAVRSGNEQANDTLFITAARANLGRTPIPYVARPQSEELARCRRYCSVIGAGAFAKAISTTSISFGVSFPPMLAAPTFGVNADGATLGTTTWNSQGGGNFSNGGSQSVVNGATTTTGARGDIGGFTGLTSTTSGILTTNAIILEAEL
jgi:hypothetical protein